MRCTLKKLILIALLSLLAYGTYLEITWTIANDENFHLNRRCIVNMESTASVDDERNSQGNKSIRNHNISSNDDNNNSENNNNNNISKVDNTERIERIINNSSRGKSVVLNSPGTSIQQTQQQIQPLISKKSLTRQQKCNIPQLNPFHEEAKPFASRHKTPTCNLKKLSKVIDGVLHLKLNDVQSAGLYYMRRHKDISYAHSKWHNLIDEHVMFKGEGGCLQKALYRNFTRQQTGGKLHISQMQSHSYLMVTKTKKKCTHNDLFIKMRSNVIHKPSGRCLIARVPTPAYSSVGCFKDGRDRAIRGHVTNYHPREVVHRCYLRAWESGHEYFGVEYGDECHTHPDAGHTYYRHGKGEGCVNGTGGVWMINVYKIEPVSVQLSGNASECSTPSASFEIKDWHRLKHLQTSKCLSISTTNQNSAVSSFAIVLGSCDDDSSMFDIPYGFWARANIDVRYPLEEEFVKVVIYHKLEEYTELHMIVLKTKEEKTEDLRENAVDQSDAMNIVLINFDSQSHANIQRQWTRSYDYFTKDPDSIIMKGHAVNGDATTENMTPLFTGYAVRNLPEARKGMKGSKYVDEWPFIFQHMHRHSYKTVFSEDDPGLGTFYFRLNGFDRQPTDKYLHPWFSANYFYGPLQSDCTTKHTLKYLKDFMKTYSREKKFFVGMINKLGHDRMDEMYMADGDVLDVFKFLNDTGFRENTTVVVFGDHGSRIGKYRATMQGKLEERLPFLSISLPPWFKKKHPIKMKNLKQNSKVLTSWFDMFQTLRHLTSLDKKFTTNRPIGTSLFTDVAGMNRTCEDCGIPIHYCPCLVTTRISIDNNNAVMATKYVVTHINEMITNVSKAARLCSKVEYKAVKQAAVVASNRQVQTFKYTYGTGECARCGTYTEENFKPKVVTYQVLFEVKNFGAMFEATVDHEKGARKEFRLNGDISRINVYGDQPKCVAKEYPHLRKFCICKNFIPTTQKIEV